MKAKPDTDFLRGIFNSIPNPIFALDAGRHVILANEAFRLLVSGRTGVAEGLEISALLPAELSRMFLEKPEFINHCEILIPGEDGSLRPFLVSVLESALGEEGLSVYTLKDITEQKQAVQSLQESESLYRTLVNQLPNPILIHIDRKVVFANDLILAVTGLDKDEILGRDVAALLTDPADDKNAAVFRNLADGSFVAEEEFEIRTENRKVVIRNFLIRNSRIKYKGQEAVMTILIDITERKHLEKYVLSRVMATEEKNRKEFATDLHDDLGPILSSIKLHMGLLEHAKTPEKFAENLAICNQQLTEAIAKMRIVANNLMPRLIENFGLEAAVNSCINTMQHEGVFEISFITNLHGKRFHKHTELHFYRIICELINNTVKHAGATIASVKLNYTRGMLRLDYTDNGKGYDVSEVNKTPGGMGVGNIIHRVNLIDAKIEFLRRKGKTLVKIRKEI